MSVWDDIQPEGSVWDDIAPGSGGSVWDDVAPDAGRPIGSPKPIGASGPRPERPGASAFDALTGVAQVAGPLAVGLGLDALSGGLLTPVIGPLAAQAIGGVVGGAAARKLSGQELTIGSTAADALLPVLGSRVVRGVNAMAETTPVRTLLGATTAGGLAATSDLIRTGIDTKGESPEVNIPGMLATSAVGGAIGFATAPSKRPPIPLRLDAEELDLARYGGRSVNRKPGVAFEQPKETGLVPSQGATGVPANPSAQPSAALIPEGDAWTKGQSKPQGSGQPPRQFEGVSKIGQARAQLDPNVVDSLSRSSDPMAQQAGLLGKEYIELEGKIADNFTTTVRSLGGGKATSADFEAIRSVRDLRLKSVTDQVAALEVRRNDMLRRADQRLASALRSAPEAMHDKLREQAASAKLQMNEFFDRMRGGITPKAEGKLAAAESKLTDYQRQLDDEFEAKIVTPTSDVKAKYWVTLRDGEFVEWQPLPGQKVYWPKRIKTDETFGESPLFARWGQNKASLGEVSRVHDSGERLEPMEELARYGDEFARKTSALTVYGGPVEFEGGFVGGRAAEAMAFMRDPMDRERFRTLLKRTYDPGYDRASIPAWANTAATELQRRTSATLLPFVGFKQFPQEGSALAITGARNWLTGLRRGPEYRTALEQSGAGEMAAFAHQAELTDTTSVPMGVLMRNEAMLRTFGTAGSIPYLEKLARKIQSGKMNRAIQRQLDELSLTPDELVGALDDSGKISDPNTIRYLHPRVSNMAMFQPGSPGYQPDAMHNPLARLLLQYKTFPIQQASFFRRNIADPIASGAKAALTEGDPSELALGLGRLGRISVGAAAPAVGISLLEGALRDRDPEKSIASAARESVGSIAGTYGGLAQAVAPTVRNLAAGVADVPELPDWMRTRDGVLGTVLGEPPSYSLLDDIGKSLFDSAKAFGVEQDPVEALMHLGLAGARGAPLVAGPNVGAMLTLPASWLRQEIADENKTERRSRGFSLGGM